MPRVPADIIMRLFSLIIQRAWQPGEMLDDWKKGNVTMPFRKSKKGDLRNYGAAEPHSLWGKPFWKPLLGT